MSNVLSRLTPAVRFPRYVQADGLWVITTYYNPCRYKSRRDNFDTFAFSMRSSGISLLVVECAFGDEPFELPESLDVVRVRSASLLWQKERLLNLAASWLPRECKYVVWADCDVLHNNADWAVDTARLLQDHAVVQTWQTCVRLVKGNHLTEKPNRVPSFCAVVGNDPALVDSGSFDRHGHTGYSWAMRRELFDNVGLYEHAVCGTGDHFVAHALCNDHGFCIRHAFDNDERQMQHLKEWSDHFYRATGGSFAVVPGEILHLWHGDLINRRYALRMHEITRLGFDPYVDVVARPGQPLEWHPTMDKPALKAYFAEYFKNRREDG
jgi:hypothetical protein